jgi:protein-S-isoprenylcysteine O-methyltransferase Ste14
MTLSDDIALIVIMLWTIIPLWWIPVHGANRFIKKLGFAIYPITFVVWFFIAYLIYSNKVFLLEFRIDFSIIIRITGILLVFAGILLQLWTLKVLTARVITGVPEVINGESARLVVGGPFSRVRHPTYLSHSLFFIGIFLSTGIITTGFVTLIDFIIVALIIVPMEENELLSRFGDEYRLYMARTPRFLPLMRKQIPKGNEESPTNTINTSKLA